MESCFVVGHKNPDTDSVVSAIAYAELKKKEGFPAKAVIAGEINKGTKLVLDRFGVAVPENKDFTKIPEACVILVDHNEEGQRADGIIKEHVLEVIDHHRFADFSSARPIYIRVQPFGSTATIVTKMYREQKHLPDKSLAGLLLAAILTDTLMFKSPTTTEQDKEMAGWLNEIVEVDMENFANEIFRAKSDISDMKIIDVINKDYKEYNFNSHIRTVVAVFETVDDAGPLARKDEFKKELIKLKKKHGYDHLLFAIVDILKEIASFIIVDESDSELLKHVFGVGEKDGVVILPGVVSRKKQMIPPLEEHFAGVDHK